MSLMTYEEARPWARSIARLVQNREMPPWDATDHTAGVFVNERTLTGNEIDTVVAWVGRGAPKGDPAKGPAPREFEDTGGFLIGRPDLIVYMEEPYFVGDDVEDEQPNFFITLTEEMLPEPRWIQAIEYQPDAEFVHHITGRALTPNEDARSTCSARTPSPWVRSRPARIRRSTRRVSATCCGPAWSSA